jgi:muramidase (phage lysozyme)
MVVTAKFFTHKRIRTITRWLRNRPIVPAVSLLILCIAIIVYTDYMQHKRLVVDPVTYTPLLQLISQAESKNNYNAYFGNASNSSIDFTKMSIAQVMTWQADYVRQGNPSNAVGKYQIISTTLTDLVKQLDLDINQKFDSATQDRLAITLLERRGAENYINKELTRNEFAANLAKEWAALPKVIGDNPEASYYASDGLNQSLVSIDEILRVIEPISPK